MLKMLQINHENDNRSRRAIGQKTLRLIFLEFFFCSLEIDRIFWNRRVHSLRHFPPQSGNIHSFSDFWNKNSIIYSLCFQVANNFENSIECATTTSGCLIVMWVCALDRLSSKWQNYLTTSVTWRKSSKPVGVYRKIHYHSNSEDIHFKSPSIQHHRLCLEN